MAAITVTMRTAIQSLASNTVDTVTFAKSYRQAEVKNWGDDRLSCKVVNTSPNASNTDPVVDGVECDHVGPGEALLLDLPYASDKIALISANGTFYSIRGVA